jgi:triacylglycerol lipase
MNTPTLCCYLSQCAYKDKDELQLGEVKKFSNLNVYDSDLDAQCFTVIINKKLYIVFRGTESFRDCLSDANIIQVPMDLDNILETEKRPEVHWGFLRQFRSLQPDIEKDIEKFEGTNIIITGHSLGAGQCTLAGLAFSFKYPLDTFSCYTYGSPRVGDNNFKNLFNKNIRVHQRFVNEDDPVTMIPLPWRYKHVSRLRFINKKDEIVNSIPYIRWKTCISEYFNYLLGRNSSPLEDHSCSAYLAKLKKNDV